MSTRWEWHWMHLSHWVGRVTFCLALLAGLTSLAHAAPSVTPVAITLEQNTSEQIVLHYQLDAFDQSIVTINGQPYALVTAGQEPLLLKAGAPELPHAARSLIIPDTGGVQVRVDLKRSAYYDVKGIDVAPSKGNLPRTISPQDVPYTFGAEYQADAFYPGELATVGQPYILRDYRGVVVDVFPWQYNPVTRTLRVYTDIVVAVAIDQTVLSANELSARPTRSLSRAFHEVYAAHFLNYAPGDRYTPLDETGGMLIICYDAWLPNIQPLVDHKNGLGIPTTAVGVSTIGNNSTAIKNYIQNAYNTGDLAFVLLVGDAAQVATPTASGGASDPSYSKLAGGDNYPDVMVGRFSAENITHVDTQVLRTIEYENLPATQQAWFKRGTGIASAEGPGDDGEYDNEHMDNIRTDLLAHGYTVVDQIYAPSGTAAHVTTALNAGRGIINYCGHGSTTAWSTTGFSNTHVNALMNDNMLPFIFSVACVNGAFTTTTCFGEAWLRAIRNGEPIGAIGAYMSSINQDWNPPMAAQDESVDLLCADAYSSYGTLCYAGSCRMMDEYSTSGVNMFNTWHVFGDPSVRVYGEALPPLSVTLPAGAPTSVLPGVPTPFTVRITNGLEDYVPGSGLLYYRYSGGSFSTAPLTPQGGEFYTATLPAADCEDAPEFYVTATGDEGTTIANPADAPATTYHAMVGEMTVIMSDNFQTPLGWLVQSSTSPALTDGAWTRGVPVNCDRGDPPTDFDGSGMCYLTDNSSENSCNSDVDGGYTWLISPTLDLSTGDAVVYYALWYTNDFGADPDNDIFNVHVSSNDGSTWVLAQSFGPASNSGWTEQSFRVGDYVTPTATVKVRFEASDLGSGSVVEAAVDAFAVKQAECIDPSDCFGDLNGDGAIDLSDLAHLLAHYGITSGASPEDGDLDLDGDVDLSDLAGLLGVYGTPCP